MGAYPAHMQAVECAVKIAAEATVAAVGEKQRHGYLCGSSRNRRQLPTVESNVSLEMMIPDGK